MPTTSGSAAPATTSSSSLSLSHADEHVDATSEEYCAWMLSCTDIHSHYWEREFSYQDIVTLVHSRRMNRC